MPSQAMNATTFDRAAMAVEEQDQAVVAAEEEGARDESMTEEDQVKKAIPAWIISAWFVTSAIFSRGASTGLSALPSLPTVRAGRSPRWPSPHGVACRLVFCGSRCPPAAAAATGLPSRCALSHEAFWCT